MAPTPPAHAPQLPATGARDADGNRLDDAFDRRLLSAAGDAAALGARAELEVVLNVPLAQVDLDDFVADGGEVRYVFKEIRYGFVGFAPLERLPGLAKRLGQRLHLVVAPREVVPFMDEATRTGRVRGIWADGFAGSGSGYSGNSNITVAVLDTGVYETHSDLSGRKQGWQDFSLDAAASPRDREGHGTHVTSIAVGSGSAFGLGPGTLRYTQSGDMGPFPKDTFVVSPIHTPAYLGSAVNLVVSSQAKFLDGGSAKLLTMLAPDGTTAYVPFGNVTSTSVITLNNQNGGMGSGIYQGALSQTDPPSISHFAVTNSVANYPGVGDGFNALRGVAPTCKWFGAKVFTDAGTGNSLYIEAALDNLVTRRVADNIKIANLSLGITGSGTDTFVRSAVNATVEKGILVVVAAGNDFPLTIGDPGRAAKAITVGASNDVNELTNYTSKGAGSPGADEDDKPDVLAPGGSAYRSQILAADTGTADGNTSGFPDMVADDYANMQGTSMATPFVSGSLALMIDALQQSGTAWTFASDAQPLFLKMLLLASATETNINREQAAGNNPTLGRAATPRDSNEGYGIINPDAAIEAMVQAFVSPLNGSVSNVAPARLQWERRAWGRNLSLVNGATVLLNLNVPSTGDYDIYLYSGAPDAKGNPVLRASSTKAGNDTDEVINFVSSATETAYVFVKRVSGYGAFSVTGSAVSHCGDGDLDTGELCDPAMTGSTTCCTSTCTTVVDGTTCDDGLKCTKPDSCQAGVCTGTTLVCQASDQCHDAGTCSAATGVCSNPVKGDGATCDDNDKCTQTDSCQAGKCTGDNPIVCTAPDQCHKVGTCAPGTGLCSNPIQTNGFACDDSDKCTQTDSCQAGKCTGTSPVTCTASDQCHKAGTCAPATGICSNPTQNDGFGCDDGDKCTTNDTCQAGSCSAGTPKTCTASDQCHKPGTCVPATGSCSNPTQDDGFACDDADKCTTGDACQAGKCSAGAPKLCVASDQCHKAGSCAPATGLCSNPLQNDGFDCDDGDQCTAGDACQAGKCSAGTPKVCVASDQCHDVGSCDPQSGACSNPAKPDGTGCDDGDKCTQLDTCQAGACDGAMPVACVAQLACHDAGVCDPLTGVCSTPLSSDGAGCDDGNPCTLGDACNAGTCEPDDDVHCTPADDCHDGGVCNELDGACKFTARPNGSPCGQKGACTNGTCVEPDPGGGGAGGEAAEAGAGSAGDPATTGGASSVGGNGTAGTAVGATSGTGATAAGGATATGGSVDPNNVESSEPHTSSGCSCRLPGAPDRQAPLGLLLGGVALLVSRARRRR